MKSISPSDLQSVNRLLQTGRAAEAAQACRQLLKRNPGVVPVMQMLGVALQRSGDPGGAEKVLREAVDKAPRSAELLLAYAGVLKQQGKTSQAERRLRKALKLAPDNAAAWHSLGLLLFNTGSLAESERCAREAVRCNPRNASAWELLAAVLQKASNASAAMKACREGLKQVPDAPRLHYSLAQLLRQESHFSAAADAYASALQQGFETPDLYRNRAEALLDSGDAKAASAFADQGADRYPGHPLLQRTAARLAFSSGADRDPLEKLRAAVRNEPHNPALWQTLVEFMKRLGREDEVAATLAEARQRGCPEAKGLLVLEALEEGQQGNQAGAMEQFERLLREFPDDAYVRQSMVMQLLRGEDAARADALCVDWLERYPHDQTILAYWGTALQLLGDERESWLLDYERMVVPVPVLPPEGFADSAAFFSALTTTLEGLHHSNAQPIEQSVRGGTQTNGFLFRLKEQILQALEGQIRQSIATALASAPDDPSHPFWGRTRPGMDADSLRFAGAWSVRLRDQGYHANHIHNEGWVSSALYISLPQEVQLGTGTEGHIQFGTPMSELGLDLPPRRVVKPEVGNLVLFPSYMWHGTLPFHSDEPRITVAFDLLPPD